MTAQITASQVKQLRDATQAGMMDAKKALVETGGDFDAWRAVSKKRWGAPIMRGSSH